MRSRGYRPLRVSLGLCALLLAAGALGLRATDSRFRDRARDFASSYALFRSDAGPNLPLSIEPAGDLEVAAVVAASGRAPRVREDHPLDREGADDLTDDPRSMRELLRAQDLLLTALAYRPGWTDHLYRVGQLDYAMSRCVPAPASPLPPRWSRILAAAAHAAPGAHSVWMTLAGAYLASWDALDSGTRSTSGTVFAHAFADEDFVSENLLSVQALLGRDRALSLLPEQPSVLRAAAATVGSAGEVGSAETLLIRTERAERRERGRDLRELEHLRRLGDVDVLRSGCRAWFVKHEFDEFDDIVGRSEVARLLELWPTDRLGSWRKDPRAKIIRFFLDGRQESVRASVLQLGLEGLRGVPDSVSARVRLLAGETAGALELAGRAGDPPSLDWTPFFVALAQRELAQNRVPAAASALLRLSPIAREECEPLLLRRQVARSTGDRGELDATSRRLEWTRDPTLSQRGRAPGSLTLCVDPEWVSRRLLEVHVGAGPPGIVVSEWNGARAGQRAVGAEETAFALSFGGPFGRRDLSVFFRSGGAGRAIWVRIGDR